LDVSLQADAIYQAILKRLEAEGHGFDSVVRETIFLRNAQADLKAVREARRRALSSGDGADHRPATTEIEQPPLDERACLEVSIQALLPKGAPPRMDTIHVRPFCTCAECAGLSGLRVHNGSELQLHAGALYGAGANAYEQTLAMFGVAEELLRKAGMELRDVVRTWIHLREIDRDYADLNRARRECFESRGIDPAPASTGIGGKPAATAHDLALGFYAVKGDPSPVRTAMTASTLNEAMSYGADFVRGMRIEEANKTALHVSGTASIDEAGRTAHPGDFEAQAKRMLVNITALLERQGASFADVVSAIAYLKRPADAEHLRQLFSEAGLVKFPVAFVEAPICRPELLCETEVLAVLPNATPGVPAKHQT
jgi:enamine deaminase RidA (YjgF/YER057c/UK114 family)